MTGAFLVVDKPEGVTSHDVVATVRAVTGIPKVGHTGTLDPFATGVLPLALGAATRLIQFLDESIKVYDATIALGAATDTGDPTGTVIREAAVPALEAARVREVLRTFLGERAQVPPAYSAVKKDGRPLYSYARKGETVEVAARPITIHDLELVELGADTLRVLITCSRGTYARVLADEIATALGSTGHLRHLSRTRSGPFWIEDAVSMPQIAELAGGEPGGDWRDVLLARGPREDRVKWRPRDVVLEGLRPHLRRPLDVLAHFPLVDVRPGDARRIRQGGALPPAPPAAASGARFLVVSGEDLVAVGEATERGPKVVKVLDTA